MMRNGRLTQLQEQYRKKKNQYHNFLMGPTTVPGWPEKKRNTHLKKLLRECVELMWKIEDELEKKRVIRK